MAMNSVLRRLVPCTVLALVFGAGVADRHFAQVSAKEEDDKPVPAGGEKPAAKLLEEAEQDKQPAKEKKSTLNEELLKALESETDDKDEAVDRLERAIAGMREAQKQIDAQDTGESTQEIQTQVVKDLEQLIDAIKNAQSQPNNQQQSKKKKKLNLKQEQQKLMQEQLNPANSSKQEQEGSEAENAKKAGQPKDGGDSTEQIQRQKTLDAERARRQQLSKDVWGHLPPALRDKLLNVYSDKYLPKYEDLVRRYYESLAERNRKRR